MNPFRGWLRLSLFLFVLRAAFAATDPKIAASATNQIGVDLYRKLAAADGNLCFSPYSIESALALALAGADGDTRTEMKRVLHLSGGNEDVPGSFAALRKSLVEMATATATTNNGGSFKKSGGDPITLAIASRLFAQKDYPFRESFLSLVQANYGATLQALDFKQNAEGAAEVINDWVAQQTEQRIKDLIPPRSLDEATRMVLANALYLKAPWAEPFEKDSTQPETFRVNGTEPADVPMMHQQSRAFGYAEKEDFVAVSLPYRGDDLRLIILLPKADDGLRKLEAKLSAEMLTACAQLPQTEVRLSLPKFKVEPSAFSLQKELVALGMKTAFDQTAGSANFDRLAPRRPNEYLFLADVFHKAFIAVDEKGTEAAAATAVVMSMTTSAVVPEEPIEVKVDHPFLYFIQQSSTGVCLFLGRMTDPR